MSQYVQIIVNGQSETVPAGSNMAALIDLFEEGHPDLIAEINGRFVHPRDYAGQQVQAGDRVEFINAAFGG
jgi:sulfur carrier protein